MFKYNYSLRVIIREKQEPSEKCCYYLFQIVTQQLTETSSLTITCSIDKLHMPQAECQYSLRSIDF